MNHIPFQASPYWTEHLLQLYQEPANPVDVVFVGDSITQMFPTDELFHDFSSKNRGIQRDLSLGINITMEERVCKLQPKVLYIMIGTNDVAYWGYNNQLTIDYIHDGLQYVRQLNKGCKIILCSVPPCCYYKGEHIRDDQSQYRPIEKIKSLNECLANYAKTQEDIYFFDAYHLLADQNSSLPLDLTLDGLHLNRKAYELLAKHLNPIILSLLNKKD